MKNNLLNPEILFEELDVGKIVSIPSDIEIPVHDNSKLTKRALCANFPNNKNIINRIEHDLNISDQTCIDNIPRYILELLAIYGLGESEECSGDIFDGQEYEVVDNIDTLKKLLSELLIRFDTDPDYYTRDDFAFLMAVLYKSLLAVYQREKVSIGENFSKIAHLVGNEIELKHPVAVADTEVDEDDEDSTIPSIAYLTGLENIKNTAQALSDFTQQEYFILDCGSSTYNI